MPVFGFRPFPRPNEMTERCSVISPDSRSSNRMTKPVNVDEILFTKLGREVQTKRRAKHVTKTQKQTKTKKTGIKIYNFIILFSSVSVLFRQIFPEMASILDRASDTWLSISDMCCTSVVNFDGGV